MILVAVPANDTGQPHWLSHTSWALRYEVQCCFTSTGTIRTLRDGEPRTATSTFTQLLSSSLDHLGFPLLSENDFIILRSIQYNMVNLLWGPPLLRCGPDGACAQPNSIVAITHREGTSCRYIGRFSEAGLHEWMTFVIFSERSCERSQRHFRADFWVGVASRCV